MLEEEVLQEKPELITSIDFYSMALATMILLELNETKQNKTKHTHQ